MLCLFYSDDGGNAARNFGGRENDTWSTVESAVVTDACRSTDSQPLWRCMSSVPSQKFSSKPNLISYGGVQLGRCQGGSVGHEARTTGY
jgi:hypothetical protein